MIETRLLRQFVAVAEELHFHRAAERLHMAQPPLSQAIARLEQRLGFALFVRHSRGVRLTPAGSHLLDTARATLHALEQGVQQARGIAKGQTGELRIGSLALAGHPELLASLKRFRQQWPQVQLTLQQASSAQLARALLDERLDLAVLRDVPELDERLHWRLWHEEALLLALPADHPRAGEPSVALAGFAEEPFVFTPRSLGSRYHQHLLELCQAAGFSPRIVQEAAQLQTVASLVACGFGVALLPASAAHANRQPDVCFVPLDDVSAPLPLYLAWRAGDGSLARQRMLELLTG
ncbi:MULTISPECIES: LysR substrate-binding domain-containing protein [unclassified Pseudomonas]|uniref:LysR substrate-binding domain-containing protein n=1 Tax=unclassified Pseudomonas TaxID=196821 RepID=UPI00244BF23F|nr:MULTISPECIES: LysR substrate-binding domain-containing protein [unclassified Pseudomonas]MDH0303229.1 LysR substrate-binding domain-containing protein [Pseudomonas sp. GD04091]MDH1987503.1 LysR substrate-binding domain-containing protein [Pseudomonas sp. GD03689]